MSGSPPQMETMGASHAAAEARQSSRLIMSLRLVEYSRMRPQPVQVRLQVWRGSSCKTSENLGVPRILCLMMCLAIFAVSANGNRIRVFPFYPVFLDCRLEGRRLALRSRRSLDWSRLGLGLAQAGQEKRSRRDAVGGIDSAAAGEERCSEARKSQP